MTDTATSWEAEDREYRWQVRAHEDFEAWRAEWPIETVLMWFEFGLVGSITVEQTQGGQPRVSWTEPAKGQRRHEFPVAWEDGV
jgi:hypothetical protein